MSVDYTGNYGIGYEVIFGEDICDEDMSDGLIDYIDNQIGDNFSCFEVGSGNYTGEDNDVYIVLKNPFCDGLDLSSKKIEIDNEIKRLKLEAIGDFDSVGGVCMW